MSFSAYKSFSCNDLTGVINFGWYALCECILTDHTPSYVLHRWCGLDIKPRSEITAKRKKAPVEYVEVDVAKLRRIKEERFLSFSTLAEMAGTSMYPFGRILRNNGGRVCAQSLRNLEERLLLKEGSLELRNDKPDAC